MGWGWYITVISGRHNNKQKLFLIKALILSMRKEWVMFLIVHAHASSINRALLFNTKQCMLSLYAPTFKQEYLFTLRNRRWRIV
jgi:hypothetical protein